MVLELFQGECLAAGPAAEHDVFSGSVQEEFSAAPGAESGSGFVHGDLASLFSVGALPGQAHPAGNIAAAGGDVKFYGERLKTVRA